MKKKLSILFAMLAVMFTTAYADNVISASDLTISKSGSADLAINLTSTDEDNDPAVRGIQFTLILPSGVSVQGSDVEFTYDDVVLKKGLEVSTTERTTGWTAVGNKTGDNTYKFVLISLSSLSGGEGISTKDNGGAVMKISFQAAGDVAAEDYQVQIKDIHLAVSESSQDFTSADTKANLTVVSYKLGDINGDGIVDVSDYIGVANRIHNNTPTGFIEEAGDVDKNGVIDVSDYIGIANLIHTGNIYGTTSQVRSLSLEDEIEPE